MMRRFATFTTPRRELLGIPDAVTGRGVRVAVVDSFFPAHPDLASTPGREIQWLDADCRPFDGAEVTKANPGRGQHGLGRAAVAGGTGASSGGRCAGVAPECELVLLNGFIVSGQYVGDSAAHDSLPEKLVGHAARLGIRAVVFGNAGERTGPLVPWQWDRQRRCCERLSAQGILVVSGTGNCPGSFSPTSLAPSALAGGGLELPVAPGSAVRAFHCAEGTSFEGKTVPEYRVPAERVVVPSLDPAKHCGVPGVPVGHVVQEGMSYGDPFMLGLVACIWQRYPEIDAHRMGLAVAEAARSAAPRFGIHPVGMPTWDAVVGAIESLGDSAKEKPTPFYRYWQVQSAPWKRRMKLIRSDPERMADILLDSLPGPAAAEHVATLVSTFRRCKDARARAAIVLLLTGGQDGAAGDHPLLDEALSDESPLVLGCALDAMRRRPALAESRPEQLARLINHPNGQVRYEALLAAEGAPDKAFVRPAIDGMKRDLTEGPLIAFFARRRLLKAITGETCWPQTRRMLPGECVYSGYWMGKQRQCADNWRRWAVRSR